MEENKKNIFDSDKLQQNNRKKDEREWEPTFLQFLIRQDK